MMTKDDIVGAAFKVWGRELYQTMSLTEIARELGVSKPALYRHFKGKNELLEAMDTAYFDNCVSFIREGYEKAVSAGDRREGYLIMMRTIAEYYIRNRDAFIFSLVRIFGSQDRESLGKEFRSRGIDMRLLYHGNGDDFYPSRLQLIVVTLIFCTALFHRYDNNENGEPTDAQVKDILDHIENRVLHGLELDAQRVAAMNYEDLEKQAATMIEDDAAAKAPGSNLLKAVAGAVAEAGPWNASMKMVARRSGLSKSGLYAHFKNRQDMMSQFFITEFTRLVNIARTQIEAAEGSEEQLYVAILAIVNYLRARPEILASIDWIKIRRLELEKTVTDSLSPIIKTIKIDGIQKQDEHSLVRIAQWILFMIVNTLAWRSVEQWHGSSCRNIDWGKKIEEVPNESFRNLFRFIALGLEGFNA